MEKQITEKQCRTCKETKTISEFYHRKDSEDGLRNECKSCTKIKMGVYYQKEEVKLHIKEYQTSEKYKTYREEYNATDHSKILQKINRQKPHRKEYNKKYRNSANGKSVLKKAHAKYCINNPEKRKAKAVIQEEIRLGRLSKANTFPCVKCGQKATEYHHCFGYEPKNWLKVIPLCRQCHINSHKLSK